jgi:predicted transposase YbfD/YdcC
MSSLITSTSFRDYFQEVDDPRIHRSMAHPLLDILFLAVTATLAGADGPSDIEAFGKAKIEWLRRFIKLPGGIPSHDTIGRVFSLIKPRQFQRAFLNWIETLTSQDSTEGPRFIPIDGKTARGSYTDADKSNPLHLVSAWSAKQGITLGQVATDQKSNEITAIPKLLELLELEGAIVTIDAMGCQKTIAQKIVDGGGDYVLAVKDNQPSLHDAIRDYILDTYEDESLPFREWNTKHQSAVQVEERYYRIAPLPESFQQFKKDWKGLRSIGQAIRLVERDGKTTVGVRYFISSTEPKVKQFAEAVRTHWSIENSLHWVLDVVFGEDGSRIRKGHATENFSFLRRFATSVLRRDTSKSSLKLKRKRAAWNTRFLEKLLFGRSI